MKRCSNTVFSRDLLVAMASRFYGSVENPSRIVDEGDGILPIEEVLQTSRNIRLPYWPVMK